MHDRANKRTCIESIKKFTIPPLEFDFTNIYENYDVADLVFMNGRFEFEQGEEPICSTVINEKTWSILTTRNLYTLEGAKKEMHKLSALKFFESGDFKGYSGQPFVTGYLHFEDDKIIRVFIETGIASMVMIYGIKTMFDETRVNL